MFIRATHDDGREPLYCVRYAFIYGLSCCFATSSDVDRRHQRY